MRHVIMILFAVMVFGGCVDEATVEQEEVRAEHPELIEWLDPETLVVNENVRMLSTPEFLVQISTGKGVAFRVASDGRIIFQDEAIIIHPNGTVTVAEGVNMTLALTQFMGAVELFLGAQGLKGMLCK